MTGFKTADEWLDFAGTVSLEIRSPLFDVDSIPGILSYPITLSDTPHNRRLLGFPATRSRTAGPVPLVPADYYIGGLLWRQGHLRYGGYDAGSREFSYQFEAEADALAPQIDGVTLPQLTYPVLGTAFAFETADYVLAPVRNATFYAADKNPAWGQVAGSVDPVPAAAVVNYAAPGASQASHNAAGAAHTYTLTPFPKLVPLLRYVFGRFDYEVTGPWLEDGDIQQLVLYATSALDRIADSDPVDSFNLGLLVPEVRIADLLLAIQKLFCVAYVFSPTGKTVSIVPLRDVAASTATAAPREPLAQWRDVPNDGDGFLLQFTADGSDDALKAAPWPELRIGNAQETIKPEADTLRMVREADPRSPGRSWLLPLAEQPGQSLRTPFDQAGNRLDHLRLLFYRGLQPDSNHQLYPLLSSGAEDYFYQSVGNYALEWDGPKGLYQQWHKPWLDFRSAARGEERDVRLSVAEFLALDPTQKDFVAGLKFLWERISIEAGGDGALGPATITYHQIAL